MSQLTGHPARSLPFSSLPAAFRHVTTQHGPKTALIDHHGQRYTFNFIDQQSSLLAKIIANLVKNSFSNAGKRSVEIGSIMVAMTPSVERVITILALWKVNSYYVPVEECIPKHRVKLMIREVRPSLIITCEEMRNKFSHQDVYAEGVNAVKTYESLLEMNAEEEVVESIGAVTENETACILYTSGSTGNPKGVVLTHGNILNRLRWQWREFPSGEQSVGITTKSLMFVDSITEMWGMLLQGKSLVVLNKSPKDVEMLTISLNKFQVTRVVLVPSLLKTLILYMKMSSVKIPTLTEVICSGATLTLDLAKDFFETFPWTKLLNFYGSTETTGDATFAGYENIRELENDVLDGAVPIGKPIDGVNVKVVGASNIVVKEGEIGEIVVEGPTVSPGYFGSATSQISHHTGDYGKVVNGKLYYVGRADDQIKIRGYRIDCNEIRSVIVEELKDVNVHVMVVNQKSLQEEVVAFVEEDDTIAKTVSEICNFHLPEYMRPKVVAVTEIPLTDIGKTDRLQLEHIYNNTLGCQSNPENLDYKTKEFIDLISNELGVPTHRISIYHDFSSIGGNSVNKVHLASSLAEKGYKFVFGDFMTASTVQEMYNIWTQNEGGKSFKKEYTIKLAETETDQDTVVRLVFLAFCKKDSFTNLSFQNSKNPLEDLEVIYPVLQQISANDQGILMVHEKESGKLVGGAILMDVAHFQVPEELVLPESLTLQLGVLTLAEACYEEREEKKGVTEEGKNVIEAGKALDFFAFGTVPELGAEENLAVTELVEEFVVELARDRGYAEIRAVNTSHVTQFVAEQHGYVTVGKLLLRDYTRADGSRPYLHAADKSLTAMVKYLDGR